MIVIIVIAFIFLSFHLQSGYFLQGQTCEKCNCLAEGSLDGECDRLTGQCRCKPRVIGLDCDRCIGSFEDISRDCLGMFLYKFFRYC